MKIFNGPGSHACKKAYGDVVRDKRYFAFLLITGTGSAREGLAARADSLTVGKEWRLVACDRGCEVMPEAEWNRLIAGHPDAVAVMLDDGAHPDGKRRPVDWLSVDALELRIEAAFSKAEIGEDA